MREGKFVAVAWKTNEHITLILCHLNVGSAHRP
jgi:hypothetical protein